MVYGRLAVSLLVGVAAMSSQAVAQERELKLGARVQVEHDSNVVLGKNALGNAQGLTPEDTRFVPSLNIELIQPVGRSSVFLSGTAGYTFYDKNTQLNRERLDFSGGGSTRLGPCFSTLSADYNRGINQVDDPMIVIDAKNIRKVTSAAIAVNCGSTSGFSVVGNVSQDWSRNSARAVQQSDYDSTTLMVGLAYRRPALGALTIFANRETVEYRDRLLSDGYQIDAVGVTFDRQLGARIQGSVTASYSMVEQDQVLLPGMVQQEQNVVSYGGDLSFRASTRLLLQASFNRGITPSVGVGQSYEISDRYRLSGTYSVGSRIVVSAGYSRVERQPGEDAIPSILVPTDSTVSNIFGSVRYKQSDNLSFELGLEREERETDVPIFDYTSNRIGLTAIATY